MKSLTKYLFILFCLLTVVCGLYTISYAEIPKLLNYQGKLTDQQNKPVTDGTYSVTFMIYDVETAGVPLWTETQSVSVSKGIFSVLLGGATNLNLAFDKPYFLEIKVGTEVMSPRQRIASAAYAFSAENGVPKGSIIMWSGSIASIPSGWVLCDGTNGTPDLRDRFVVGAKQDDNGVAKTYITGLFTQLGGSVNISLDNLPPHDHGPAGEHTHDYIFGNAGGTGNKFPQGQNLGYNVSGGILSAPSHTHASVGSGKSYIQPYYALAYIMKQ